MRPRSLRPSAVRRRSSKVPAAAVQVEELEQVGEGDLGEASFDVVARLAHHRVELGAARDQLGDALADLVGVGVGRHVDRAPLGGRRALAVADEDEAHAAGTRVGAQDLDQLGGLDQRQPADRHQHLGHLGDACLERVGTVHDRAGRVSAHGARLADPVRAVRVGVGNHDEAAHGGS
jgi:hypothetical protein